MTSTATTFCVMGSPSAGASRAAYAAAPAATAAKENTELVKHIQATPKPTRRPKARLAYT